MAPFVTAVLVGTMALTGCAAGNHKNPAPTTSQGEPAKPPLSIPSSFKDETSKREFAVNAVIDGYYAEVITLLEETSAKAPHASAFAFLGTAKYNLNDYEGAMKSWLKAAEMNPNLASEVHTNIGNALRDLKKFEAAEASYRKAMAIDPTHWAATINLADMLKSQGNPKSAITALEKSLSVNNNAEPLVSLLNQYRAEIN